MITIYHHPHCSKSREGLQLTQAFAAARGLPLTVVDYQKTPLTLAQLSALHRQLGAEAGDMVRANEEEFAAQSLAGACADALLQALAAHPKLLQRPIVVANDAATIGRPPERLPTWLASRFAAA